MRLYGLWHAGGGRDEGDLSQAYGLAVNGDGDFLMNGQELATAVQYKLPIIAVVLDNSTFGTIRMHQEREYPGRVSGTDLLNPDFAAMARAFGGFGAMVDKTEDFAPAFLPPKQRPAAVIHVKFDAEGITPTTTLSALRKKAQAPNTTGNASRTGKTSSRAAASRDKAQSSIPGSRAIFGWRVRYVMGVENRPAILMPHPRDGGLDRVLVPAAHFQRNGVELCQIDATRIEARMHAANGSEAPRHHFLGAQAGLAIGIGIADQRRAVQKGRQELLIALGVGFQSAVRKLGVG